MEVGHQGPHGRRVRGSGRVVRDSFQRAPDPGPLRTHMHTENYPPPAHTDCVSKEQNLFLKQKGKTEVFSFGSCLGFSNGLLAFPSSGG